MLDVRWRRVNEDERRGLLQKLLGSEGRLGSRLKLVKHRVSHGRYRRSVVSSLPARRALVCAVEAGAPQKRSPFAAPFLTIMLRERLPFAIPVPSERNAQLTCTCRPARSLLAALSRHLRIGCRTKIFSFTSTSRTAHALAPPLGGRCCRDAKLRDLDQMVSADGDAIACLCVLATFSEAVRRRRH